MQTMAQVSKPITPSTPTSTPNQTHMPTPTTPIQTQFLQKQLEQPLKMENQNMTMQPVSQHQQQSLPQMHQFQISQHQKSAQNVSLHNNFGSMEFGYGFSF